MCRTALIAVALALFATAGAHGAQTTQAAKTHRRSPAAAHAHGTRRVAQRRGARETAGTHLAARDRRTTHSTATHSTTEMSEARRQTPEEAGREAGLAIRRQLAERERLKTRRRARLERVRAVRRAEFEPAELRRERAREDDSDGAEPTQPVPSQDFADERSGEERPDAVADDATAAEAPAETDAASGGAAMSRNSAEAAESDSGTPEETTDRTDSLIESRRANPDEDSDEASLYIPRAGMPAPLRGSLASLERQNSRLDAEGLERIEDEADLDARIADKLLVPVPVSSALTVNADLPENHRYCRPWTAKFLADLARAHEAEFHKPLEVSSAVRTVEYQKRLMETNGNAAPAEGDIVSPHETGATVDIAKHGLTLEEIAWMRRRLAALQATGKIDVEEEFQQACFHITVYKTYAPAHKAGEAVQGKAGAGKSRHDAPENDSIDDQGV